MSFESSIIGELNGKIGVGTFSIPKIIDKPISLGEEINMMAGRGDNIHQFFNIVSKIAKEAIENDNHSLLHLLFSEQPAGMDISYHKALPDCCWRSPVLYRTDQSLSGKIYEIQSPGSGWGDLFLYAKCLSQKGYTLPNYLLDYSNRYAEILCEITHKEHPNIFHMIDAASVPYSMRYLMAVTEGKLQYWGLNENVDLKSIDCLIAHSVQSIVTTNYFKLYLERAKRGELIFAIPPNIIFDEKIIYLLPFYRETKSFFPDGIRDLFPYTTLIENGGFFDNNDQFISFEEFLQRPRKNRKLYLKYGGPDTNRNWGSRSVYRLDGKDCRDLLVMANELSCKGEVWLIQQDVVNDYSEDITDDLKLLLNKKGVRVKLSAFYSSDQFLGSKIMARHHFKVHGQKDTIVGIGV